MSVHTAYIPDVCLIALWCYTHQSPSCKGKSPYKLKRIILNKIKAAFYCYLILKEWKEWLDVLLTAKFFMRNGKCIPPVFTDFTWKPVNRKKGSIQKAFLDKPKHIPRGKTHVPGTAENTLFLCRSTHLLSEVSSISLRTLEGITGVSQRNPVKYKVGTSKCFSA